MLMVVSLSKYGCFFQQPRIFRSNAGRPGHRKETGLMVFTIILVANHNESNDIPDEVGSLDLEKFQS